MTDSRRKLVESAVESWVGQLRDRTGRNNLLYYKHLKRGSLELTEAAPPALSRLLAGQTVPLAQLLPSTLEYPERLDDALKNARTIHRKVRGHFEERGLETLFLAYGMASWTTEATKATPASPVLLRPVRLSPKGAGEKDFELVFHGDWEVNESLLDLLASEFGAHVSGEELLALLGDDDPKPQNVIPLFTELAEQAAEVSEFEVVPRLVIGTFLYTKLPMVRDLDEHIEQLVENDLIAAIAGDEEAREAIRKLHETWIDPSLPDYTPPDDEYLILDADSSQNEVINRALAEEPLIIEGPPGTGKSQTIANLIASLTARGKRVLFVAEKRAAIDAVTKRLHNVGLDGLVMDIHGGVTSKKQTASDLDRTLERMAEIPATGVEKLHENLDRSRRALLAHNAAVHEKRMPWHLSIWEVNSQLLGLPEEARRDIHLTPSQIEKLRDETATQARASLVEWAYRAKPLVMGDSPWAGSAGIGSTELAEEVLASLKTLHGDLRSLQQEFARVLDETGLPDPGGIDEWQSLFQLLEGVEETLAAFQPGIFDVDLELSVRLLSPGAGGWFERLSAQVGDNGYRGTKKLLRQLWAGTGKPTGPELHSLVTSANRQLSEWASLCSTRQPCVPSNLGSAKSLYDRVTAQLRSLEPHLPGPVSAWTPAHISEAFGELVDDQQVLFRLPSIRKLEEWLGAHHLGPLIDLARSEKIAPDIMESVFDHVWLSSIRSYVLARDPRLANFDGALHRKRVEEYRKYDLQHLNCTPRRVERAVAERAVVVRNDNPKQDEILRAEAHKRRGHLPMRRLFELAPDVLTALRPCWVMSPLVVSQTLPPEQLFDVVVFDEASQVLPGDAVPALLRAPQAIVAGDPQQLPPTTFFDSATDGDEDPDDYDEAGAFTEGFESILDVLSALLRLYRLKWHYRSYDERLIAFSNKHIYNRSLVTFPGAYHDGCLRYVLVPHQVGVRVDTRGSDAEVSKVVDLMCEHARRRPDESLGVIAMGIYHANRIDAGLRARLAEEEDPELDAFFDETLEERAFVKNLERVQGDERDAIILSVGYGKQPDGRLLYKFGPLNMEGGERRLNVAVTRARRRVSLVASFSHADMNRDQASRKGVELLESYLKYVASGGRELADATYFR